MSPEDAARALIALIMVGRDGTARDIDAVMWESDPMRAVFALSVDSVPFTVTVERAS